MTVSSSCSLPLQPTDLDTWLRTTEETQVEELLAQADAVRRQHVGDEVHLRGLIEFGNVCDRGCTYCGIRKGNVRLARYRMSADEILRCATQAHAFGYGTVVLQSGEDRQMAAEWLADVIAQIKQNFPLAVTLSVSERPLEDYRLWREAGADRVLLKFETSDPELYRHIHPPLAPDEPSRIEQLRALRELGYEIGSGIMVGIPGQTFASLVRDIELFAQLDLDMIGIGPFIPNPHTPLGQQFLENKVSPPDQVPATDLMTCKVIALARLLCPEANIPATTALATVDPCGFEHGLRAGANVIMPNLTPLIYRALYQIYPVTVYQAPEELHRQILRAIALAGRRPGQGPGGRRRHSG